jgi:hypothetical protein
VKPLVFQQEPCRSSSLGVNQGLSGNSRRKTRCAAGALGESRVQNEQPAKKRTGVIEKICSALYKFYRNVKPFDP